MYSKKFIGFWMDVDVFTNNRLTPDEKFYLSLFKQYGTDADYMMLDGGYKDTEINLIKLHLYEKHAMPKDIK